MVDEVEREILRIKDDSKREKFLKEIQKITGTNFDTFNRFKETLGRGMQEGAVNYTPLENNPQIGILSYQTEEEGKTVTKRKKIKNEQEAKILFALQKQADSKKAT